MTTYEKLEMVCYLAVIHGILSRWKCASLLGFNLAEMDDWEKNMEIIYGRSDV